MKFIDGLVCDLDLESAGKRIGAIALTVSDSQNDFATIQIPIAVIAHGTGPTVLLSAGNHGNEYEGQVILRRLIHDTAPEQVRGRLIVLPALNYPAVMADARVSPLDGGNLNRSFPGRPDAGPTAAIADYVSRSLLPLADAGIDLHSGGRSAAFVPCAFLCTHPDPAITQRSLAMAEAFGAPYVYVSRGRDGPAAFDPVAHDAGVAFISTELAGGGGVDVAATAVGHAGVHRVLHALGVLGDAPSPAVGTTRFLNGIDAVTTVFSPITGVFEPFHDLGAEVSAGQPAGRVWSLEEVERPPRDIVFPAAGVIAVKRVIARVPRGGHLYVVASEMPRAAVLHAEAGTPD